MKEIIARLRTLVEGMTRDQLVDVYGEEMADIIRDLTTYMPSKRELAAARLSDTDIDGILTV